MVTDDRVAEIHYRLQHDFPFYAQSVLKVVDRQRTVLFKLRPVQVRFWEALNSQREQGIPMRAVVLKARKVGISTMTQGFMLQRVTQRPNHGALIVAQDNKTSAAIVRMAEFMYSHLPEWEDAEYLKPPIRNTKRDREFVFGEPSRLARHTGDLGVNSKLVVDNAKELEAGRGETFHSIHCSEVASWADAKTKLTAILNTVPDDDPDTLVVLESTAYGHNHFKVQWDRAENGESDFLAFFSPWFEDDRYQRSFTSSHQMEKFESSLGTGSWGADEPGLVEAIPQWFSEHGQKLPHKHLLQKLHWRRWAIENRTQGDLESFHQEFPSFPHEAFLSTGRKFFSAAYVRAAMDQASKSPEPESLLLESDRKITKQTRGGTVDVPAKVKVLEKPSLHRLPFWEVWERPIENGQYVIGVDPAGGDGLMGDDQAHFAIEVINHRTRTQVAQWEGIMDSDLVAEQIMLVALWYAESRSRFPPWVAVEKTGGYGSAILTTLYHEYGYKRVYTRRSVDRHNPDKHDDRLGWDTNRATKQLLHDEATALLREGTHGIRSLRLAKQLETYVRKPNGRVGPSEGSRSDLLMAWMIAQQIAHEKKPDKDRSKGIVSTATRAIRNPTVGW